MHPHHHHLPQNDIHVLIPGIWKCTVYGKQTKKGIFAAMIKTLEEKSLVIQVGP